MVEPKSPTPFDAAPRRNSLSPAHYRGGAIQPIDYIAANRLTFNLGNAVKYLTRHERKNGAEDLQKAIEYIKRELFEVYGRGDSGEVLHADPFDGVLTHGCGEWVVDNRDDPRLGPREAEQPAADPYPYDPVKGD